MEVLASVEQQEYCPEEDCGMRQVPGDEAHVRKCPRFNGRLDSRPVRLVGDPGSDVRSRGVREADGLVAPNFPHFELEINPMPPSESKRRVAYVRMPSEVSAAEIGLVFAALPDGSSLVRADFVLDSDEHLFIFRSSRFREVPVGERPGEIIPKWEWKLSEDGDSRQVVGVDVKWPEGD